MEIKSKIEGEMHPIVSIILPVYNAENTIRKCIESVLNQTFREFELIIVNDGSKDHSGEICEEYKEKDKRIKVFHKENRGVSHTRNFALDQVEGEYIQFMDSDDWITPDAVKELVEASRTYKCDLIISDFYRVVNERVSVKGDIEDTTVMTREEFAAHMMENPADFYYGVLWNKLYKKSIIEEHHLRMNPQIDWCEDFLFNLEYIRYVGQVYALKIPIYYYVKTKGSLVSQGLNITNIIQMKITVFAYYNKLYKEIFDEEEYQKQRRKVYGFLLDAAGDGIVMPTILPSVQKLGEERVTISKEMLKESGIMADFYRAWKLLQRCVESVAMRYDLSLNEGLVLLALGRDGFYGKRKTLAELSHVSRPALSHALIKLEGEELIEMKRNGICVCSKADEILVALEKAMNEWKSLCFMDFDEQEIVNYKQLSRRIYNNINRALR